MRTRCWKSVFFAVIFVLIFAGAAIRQVTGGNGDTVAHAQTSCQQLTSPQEIPAPALIDFDDAANGLVIGSRYQAAFGVTFEDSPTTRALIYGNEPTKAASSPNVATNDAVYPNTSNNVPMKIWFDEPKTHVGFYIGNGGTSQLSATLIAYDASGKIICRAFYSPVPDAHTVFLGVYDPQGAIMQISLDYGNTSLSEAIDDLYFAPRKGSTVPTRTPVPTWTPVPPPTATPGPTPTPTPNFPVFPFIEPAVQVPPPFLTNYDLSFYGIEVTQGIQCFDTGNGLSACPDNSLPLAASKSTVARIYMKYSGPFDHLSNVPVRFHIRLLNGTWQTVTAYGKAVSTLDQGKNDSANVFFYVTTPSNAAVQMYAEVDPFGDYAETNEGNNRYPSSGYLTLNFQQITSLTIVGDRLRYHPSGYTGSQYAGGWAVNGGAATWLNQVLPLANNAVDYSVASGYLDWTTSLGSGSGQHSLIQTLNTNWVIENAFSWLFTGPFVGADHVYGWAPNAGYSGGHADMPVYPHAGGLGVVAIGSDRAGTSTDDPGGGALIFGHELVHDYNVMHTNTADSCGSNDAASNFPYSSSSIQEYGFNPITGKIYKPTNTHDLMSYCPAGGSKQGWISPFTWSTMFINLSPGWQTYYRSERSLNIGYLMPTAAQESLVVNATIFNPAYNPQSPGQLNDLHRIATNVAYYPLQGDYSIELRDAKGNVLLSQPFVVNFESEYDAHGGTPHGQEGDPPPFPPDPTTEADVAFIIPWVSGTTTIALTHLGQDVDVRTVSANPPQVFFTSPLSDESWTAGSTHTLTWDGSDLDGDTLTYALFYSYDGGLSWGLLQSGITATSFDVTANSLVGGSDVRFRVTATDGVNTDYDETPALISLPNHAPIATILDPAADGIHLPGSLVVFQGTGFDMEDGTLPDASLTWSDDIQGELGHGAILPTNTLQPGTHTVTLTVRDSLGMTHSQSVTIFVGYPLYLPLLAR